MLKVSAFIPVLTALSLSSLQAECIYPTEVVIPDGAESSYEEMRDGQTYVKEYMAEMEAYLDCLERVFAEQENDQGTVANESVDSIQSEHLEQRIAAIDAMESVAARFNEQVRAYKLANP